MQVQLRGPEGPRISSHCDIYRVSAAPLALLAFITVQYGITPYETSLLLSVSLKVFPAFFLLASAVVRTLDHWSL